MAVVTMAWLSGANKANNSSPSTFSRFWPDKSSSPCENLQILSFETARTMSRLVGLYKFLSDGEFSELRNGVMKSRGVSYLNSDDERFLLNLVCAEKLEELDCAAITVSRLGQKCSNIGLKRFDVVFGNLKEGITDGDMKLEYNSRYAQKIVEKMEKYVSATSCLFAALEVLAEMDLSERKLKLMKLTCDHRVSQIMNNQTSLEEKLAFQRKRVKHYKETSLWDKTFEQSASLMASIICITYTRICELFGSFVSCLPNISKHCGASNKSQPFKVHPDQELVLVNDEKNLLSLFRGFKSGSLPKSPRRSYPIPTRFFSEKLELVKLKENTILGETGKTLKQILSSPPNTVGDAGLALRYANIIILAERYSDSQTSVDEDGREFMYDILPASLKAMVRSKLRSRWDREEEEGDDRELAEGWRVAVEEILRWLAPMAHDTVQWHTDRNLEKQKFESDSMVLKFQTLYFSDLEKTEAAVAEVLVGLSCIYRYENRRRMSR
ncbi:hypothetical protein K2173_001702 [Erythroxylum novogranatense]|uniref:Avr9/Cf-9 rapidly elicited protein 137 n=1 Tax=Erythroxylum novogranatense TaxID=1862640 RepID=A0AAV8S4V9_9ROSI|nr:hypothetical protein K2173_001702 [Erythroxylum novogranatense]